MDTETALLESIRANPDDQLVWQAYADWLQERGDPRGEYLLFQSEFLQLERRHNWGAETKERLRHARRLGYVLSRLRRLRAKIPLSWIIQVHRGHIQNCLAHFSPASGRRCPNSWARLKETPGALTALVRTCKECGRLVQYCETISVANRAVERNRTVTLPDGLTVRLPHRTNDYHILRGPPDETEPHSLPPQ